METTKVSTNGRNILSTRNFMSVPPLETAEEVAGQLWTPNTEGGRCNAAILAHDMGFEIVFADITGGAALIRKRNNPAEPGIAPFDIIIDHELRLVESTELLEGADDSSRIAIYTEIVSTFTAHEIAHTMFFDWNGERPTRLFPNNSRAEEIWCDYFAFCLLAPGADQVRKNCLDKLCTGRFQDKDVG